MVRVSSDTAERSERLLLINPSNPLISMVRVRENRWNRYRLWKPLGLLTVAALTPPAWDPVIVDENLGEPDYAAMPRPDLVGITAFTSQANRAYELAGRFRKHGVPVVMGGIHATTCAEEALKYVDAVVTGEAEAVWPRVLDDARGGRLERRYEGGQADLQHLPPARHDLLTAGYLFGAVQTSRGCPLDCSFCSVKAISGTGYRHRPIPDVVREMALIRERGVLVVDDNLIGTRPEHLARAKELFRAIADADLRKEWIGQVTINFADDEELIELAARAGCRGVYVGFESPTAAGLGELRKRFNLAGDRDLRAAVRRIQRHKILVVGSFVIGLDVDGPGIGRRVADAAARYGVNDLNVMFLTPLPGTRLWDQMLGEDRIILDEFPRDWQHYTMGFPVARYRHLSLDASIDEVEACNARFYSLPRLLLRVGRDLVERRQPVRSLVSNLAYRKNARLSLRAHEAFRREQDGSDARGGSVIASSTLRPRRAAPH
jgi:radical SAM superfamily enzyme YgiQ (UPF0313 family)